MKVWTVGTSSAVPSRNRNLPANLISFQGERVLFDCGEGTQRTLMQEKLGLMKISRVFISHWHADHFSGLLGLIQTLEMEGREEPLYIYGPPRTEEFTDRILDTGYFNRSYDIFVEDLVEGDEIVGEGYTVKPFEVEHGVNAFGFAFEEDTSVKANKEKMKELGLEESPKIGKLKNGESIEWNGETIEPEEVVEEVPGRKIVYSGDTAKCRNTIEYSESADLLIHEATCSHEMIKDRKGHTSARQAAEIAEEAGVSELVLTHISRRYQEKTGELLSEAREVFKDTEMGEDGREFDIKSHRPED
ncbi:ribonuclease Z [Candidatus Nanohalobium constans]|uniref:Ribonuclease Z n=1 Tax=Candidatus Nanohalobium constans TaxID=2565781 RepID=A0A5Q0UF20_9ARCH|nr:ribonuclease Z [Candidatus Nanohalobium constans]QGA80146.1 ribonuclease Z [Candidatus Nanohalobium constans]